jgi:multisubunit Na+/H+ antiporter MnhG subunit
MSFAIIGGIFLNIGAFLTFKGKIYEAVAIYLIADICWIVMAYEKDDMLGMISITVGVSFGLLAFLKMRSGEMRKNLNRDENGI